MIVLVTEHHDSALKCSAFTTFAFLSVSASSSNLQPVLNTFLLQVACSSNMCVNDPVIPWSSDWRMVVQFWGRTHNKSLGDLLTCSTLVTKM